MIKKYFPCERWEKDIYTHTSVLKAVSEYTGLNFQEILNLQYPLFLLYRRDAWIYRMGQSEQGEKLLGTIWRLRQTEADEDIASRFGRK